MKHTRSHRGYTLLEMIVSVGLFSIIMLLATGAYFTLIKIDREARAVNDVVSNLSFAVDSVSREIRTGTAYKCNNEGNNPNCTDTAGTSFGYTDSVGRDVSYWLSGSNQIIATIDGEDSPFTDPRIHIDTLSFYVRGVNEGVVDTVQPQTLIAIEGSIITSPEKTVTFSIQTTATQRLLEL
jgi:prepilin-type N-terminal cleavage/methylation domain-containing protein